jgi:hypothetical protein
LDVIGKKVKDFSSFLFTVTSYNGFYPPSPLPPPPQSKSAFKVFVI